MMARIVSLHSLFAAVLVGSCLERAHTYHVPESARRIYRKGERVQVKSNSVRSARDFGFANKPQLPLCRPGEGIPYDDDKNQNSNPSEWSKDSPYSIRMLQDVYCEQLCIENLTVENKFVRAITDDFRHQWILNGVAAATRLQNDKADTTHYWDGHPVGFVGSDGKFYVNNHMNIEIYYHPIEGETDAYHIVHFIVQPFSIHHDFEIMRDDALSAENSSFLPQIANITNPIPSCKRRGYTNQHTDFDMMNDHRGNASLQGQLASGLFLYTYDVIWKKDSGLRWTSRWDVFLSMERTGIGFYWKHIVSMTVFVAVMLAGMVVLAPIRHLRREMSRLNVSGRCEQEGYGWTLLHGDVFRPPSFCPDGLAIAAGSGAHLLATFLLVIGICSASFYESLVLNERGSVIMIADDDSDSLILGILLIYAMLGCVGGYVTVFFCRIFGCDDTNRATWITALGFPGLCLIGAYVFMVYVVLACFGGSVMVFCKKSNRAWIEAVCGSLLCGSLILLGMTDPFEFPVRLFLWLVVLVPSCFTGAWLCQRRGALPSFPVNSEPSKIPKNSWLLRFRVVTLVSGMAGFGVISVEDYYMIASVWFHQDYSYDVGFAYHFWVSILLILVTAMMTVLGTYVQLHRQDYEWWWRSFYTGGATAFVLFWSLYVFLLAMRVDMLPFLVCTSWMALISFGIFLALGFVGITASLLFTRFLYGSIPCGIDVDVDLEPSLPEMDLEARNKVGDSNGCYDSTGVPSSRRRATASLSDTNARRVG